MSKASGSQKRRQRLERSKAEHQSIVREAAATYRAYFVGWERAGGQYRRIIRTAMRGRNNLPMTYKKQSDRPPSPLTVETLAVVLLAVDGFGESKGGVSAARINQAFGLCGVGKSLAKIAPSLRALNEMGLIEWIGKYKKGRSGNQYRLTDTCLNALGRPIAGTQIKTELLTLPPPPKRPPLPMSPPKPKVRRPNIPLEIDRNDNPL